LPAQLLHLAHEVAHATGELEALLLQRGDPALRGGQLGSERFHQPQRDPALAAAMLRHPRRPVRETA
jgi:hypothetical protein